MAFIHIAGGRIVLSARAATVVIRPQCLAPDGGNLTGSEVASRVTGSRTVIVSYAVSNGDTIMSTVTVGFYSGTAKFDRSFIGGKTAGGDCAASECEIIFATDLCGCDCAAIDANAACWTGDFAGDIDNSTAE